MFRNSFLSSLNNFGGNLPFGVPNATNGLSNTIGTSRLLTKTSKFSLTGILDNASKTINTINQIVPLYQQVKPMFSNAKTALNIFKNVKNINNTPSPSNVTQQNEVNTKSVHNDTKSEQKETEATVIIPKTIPNKPFFV